MNSHVTGTLLEKHRSALIDFCIGALARKSGHDFLKTEADLSELFRTDVQNTLAVETSYVAEATSCAQQFIDAVLHKLEPGYQSHTFNPELLERWKLERTYSEWAAAQLIQTHPSSYINAYVRQRKTSLFRILENDLNQTRLSADSVLIALRNYLQAFERICNLDVISGYMDGLGPADSVYCFIGRERVPPYQYYVRKVRVELLKSSRAVNPAAWDEWQAVDIPAVNGVLDMRPLIWNGRLCVVWAQWRDKVTGKTAEDFIPHKLDINLAFMTENGQWSAPLSLHSSEHADPVTRPDPVRLIATIWTDHQHPKGKLGVLLTGTVMGAAVDENGDREEGRAEPSPFNQFAVFDVLMRPVTDSGAWLTSARDDRFLTAETVQHPLGSQVTIVSEDAPAGSMTPYLDLNVFALRVGENDVLTVDGLCRPTPLDGNDVMMKLTILGDPPAGDPPPVETMQKPAGNWTMPLGKFTRTKGTWPNPTSFSLGTDAAGYGRKKFDLSIVDLMDFIPPTLLKNTIDAAQFLDLNLGADYALKYVRLNSLFGPELVQRANISPDAVLDWQTQHLKEPGPTGIPAFEEPNGPFDGANGLFFWELFFHAVHLVATRLRDEDRFSDAQQWLHYLFAPHAPADPDTVPDARPSYWRCRPLTGPGNSGAESLAPLDPDAIAYSEPKHYRLVVFVEYVKNLMAWGDWYYRQLTRESLAAAHLRYVQAGFFMGKPPSGSTVSRWQAVTLGALLEDCSKRPDLEKFESEFQFSLADIPAGSDVAPQLGLLACGPFKIPINQVLVDWIEAPQKRLFNLRNNLTIDGRPLDIPLFSPPADPNQLLRDRAAGSNGRPRSMGQTRVIAFYWRVAFELALRAVETMQQFAAEILNVLERRDRAEQEELQQSHLVELGNYALTVQEQTIAQMEAVVVSLTENRQKAVELAQAYATRYEENVSDAEYAVMSNLQRSKELAMQSSALRTAGGAVAALPKIFGMSNGGALPEQILFASADLFNILSIGAQADADKQGTNETYRRRRNDWALQRDQALAEVRAIDAQIVAQNHAVAAARINLAQTLRANGQAVTMYNFLKKRATNAELFNWMLGQLKALHYQAYDAVVSLCLSAQASLSAETGNYAVNPPPQVLHDQYHGLTAANHLRNYLLLLEREYVQRTELKLQFVRTISLRSLCDDVTDPQPGIENWAHALKQLCDTGALEFRLTQLLFDRDYPGHYCRQISSVAVTLPVVAGPFENTRMILTQVSNMTATQATAQSVQYLLDPTGDVAPVDVVHNVRSGQQIAISLAVGDDGTSAVKPEEGLLRPFQFTGLIGTFSLYCPWFDRARQAQQLASLTDIIFEIHYTARAGDPTFTQKVMDLVIEAEENAEAAGKGGRGHA
ncbi:Tc toxin subunit A-related protein [Pseudomonas sp. H3_G09]